MLVPFQPANNVYNDNPEISGFYSSDDEAQAPLVSNDNCYNSLPLVLYQSQSSINVTNNNNQSIITPKFKQNMDNIHDHNEKLQQQLPSDNRWRVLILLCIQSISIWYSFDTLTILHNEFYEQLKFTDFEYNLLYSIAVFPSLILSFLASFILKKVGITYSMLISLLISFIGCSLFAISCTSLSFKFMLFARLIYGFGSSWNAIVSFIILYKYFKETEFATSLSISFSCVRLGFLMNDFITVHIVNSFDSLALPIWFGTFLIFLSFLCTVYMIQSVFIKSDIAKPQISELDSSHLHSFRIGFWLLSLICGLGFAFFSTWSAIAVHVIQRRYGILDESSADYYLLIMYAIPCVISPLYGVILDRNRSFYCTLLIGGIFGIIGHIFMMIRFEVSNEWFLWLNVLFDSPIISLIFLGFGYTLFVTSLWPSIPSMIDSNKLGTGYGLIYAFYCICYSISQLIIPIFVHESNDETKYDYVCAYLIVLSVIYCIIAIILYLWKKDDEYRLNYYKSLSNSSMSPSLRSRERKYESESESESVDQSEGGDVNSGGGGTVIMGALDKNVSVASLFSDENQEMIKIDKDEDEESEEEDVEDMNDGGMSETMLGFIGENDKIVIKSNDEKENDK